MRFEHAFTFPLASGLHARPATALREWALPWRSECLLLNERNGQVAELRNILSLLATDTQEGDPCRLRVTGPDAQEAGSFLVRHLETVLPGLDTASDLDPRPEVGIPLRRLLQRTAAIAWSGTAVSPGIATGRAVLASLTPVREPGQEETPDQAYDPTRERRAFWKAIGQLTAILAEEARLAAHPVARDILVAQAHLLADEAWLAEVDAVLDTHRCSASHAVDLACQHLSSRLEAMESQSIQGRALDLRDLSTRLQSLLGDSGTRMSLPPLEGPSILVTPDLTPSQFLDLDRSALSGLVLTQAGPSSHTVILARSFGIPCMLGPSFLPRTLSPDTPLLLDGDRGLLVATPPEPIRRYYGLKNKAVAPARTLPTFDGKPITLMFNLSLPEEADRAFEAEAEGIGLFRSEMLYLNRTTPPDETEQVAIYRRVLDAAQGRPVTLRLLDVGGDKPLPYLHLPEEPNPHLGLRGVRWYSRQPALVRVQVRAALRAAREGDDLRLMVPMVSDASEMLWVRRLMEEEARHLGHPLLPLGAMVEVPVAALHLDPVLAVSDFLCVGTNDLIQYLFAADRNHTTVARADHQWHPATLRLLDQIVRAARAASCPLSLCGELAGRPALLPLLVGLGFETLSLAPGHRSRLQAVLPELHSGECTEMVQAALNASGPDDVMRLLEALPRHRPERSVLEPDLVAWNPASLTPEELIHHLALQLHAQGRITACDLLEEALWEREQAYSTSIGHGFAVPHASSPAVIAPSLAVARLEHPLVWESVDGEPIHTVLLLATPSHGDGRTHLRLFARLARRLMDETFRADLRQAPDPFALSALLQAALAEPSN